VEPNRIAVGKFAKNRGRFSTANLPPFGVARKTPFALHHARGEY
jgi:hypothetical protein